MTKILQTPEFKNEAEEAALNFQPCQQVGAWGKASQGASLKLLSLVDKKGLEVVA